MNEPKFVLSAADRAGLPEGLHPLAETHGPEMLKLIVEAGVAREAGTMLSQVLYMAQHQQGLQALRVLLQALNTIADGQREAKGWTHGEMMECQQAVERVLDAQVVVAKPRIILPH